MDDGKLSDLRCALKILEGGPQALARPASDLNEAEARKLLREIEAQLAAQTTAQRTSRLSVGIRRLLYVVTDILRDGKPFSECILDEAPRFFRRKRPVKNELPSSLGHIAHLDWSDLRRQTKQLIRQRLDAIDLAVQADLEAYAITLDSQNALLDMPISRSLAAAYAHFITRYKESKRLPPQGSAECLTAYLLQELNKKAPLYNASGIPQVTFPPIDTLSPREAIRKYQYRQNSAPWFLASTRLPNPILTSIFLLLLARTGWNLGSVGSLTSDRISKLDGGGYSIQGYKQKTDDDTPIHDIPSSDRILTRSVELLLWNQGQLKLLGLIPSEERRLWFGWQRDGFQATVDLVSGNEVKKFCERHKIDRFLPSELRPLRASDTYLLQSDIEAVRLLLGHKDLGTTDSYLRNTLFWRMNESNMLQFQRRIETTITFHSGGINLVEERRLEAKDLDATLIPTGDGGSCIDPSLGPPIKQLNRGSPCAGMVCQYGKTCPQYRLVVNVTTLEMALRSRIYYRSQWENLMRLNLSAFANIHLPRLLYIHVLLLFVKDRRPDLLVAAEQALQ